MKVIEDDRGVLLIGRDHATALLHGADLTKRRSDGVENQVWGKQTKHSDLESKFVYLREWVQDGTVVP